MCILAKTCFSIKIRCAITFRMTILLFCVQKYIFRSQQRIICIVLAKACFSVQKIVRLPFDYNLILLWKIYAQSPRRVLLFQSDYLSDDNLILLQRNSHGVLYTLKQRIGLSDDNVLVYYNSATTFRMTILLFCTEIHALSKLTKQRDYLSPRRVLQKYNLKGSATTFRMTILLFCIEIYAISLSQGVFLYKRIRLH